MLQNLSLSILRNLNEKNNNLQNSFKLFTEFLREKDVKGGAGLPEPDSSANDAPGVTQPGSWGRRISPFSLFLSILRFFFFLLEELLERYLLVNGVPGQGDLGPLLVAFYSALLGIKN